MKFSKELQEFIDKQLEECEREEREGRVKYYTEEEAFEIMFGNLIREGKMKYLPEEERFEIVPERLVHERKI